MTVFEQLSSAFFGSLGFVLLFNIRGNRIVPAALGGLISWGVYLAFSMGLHAGDVLSYVIASAVLTLYSEYMAHRMKAPTTVFLVSAAIPLIPGGMLYSTMRAAVAQQWTEFFHGSVKTLMLTMAIAGGILFAMTARSVVRRIFALIRASRGQAKKE